jgi:hypothetical protein
MWWIGMADFGKRETGKGKSETHPAHSLVLKSIQSQKVSRLTSAATMNADVLDHATSEIAIGTKLGISFVPARRTGKICSDRFEFDP